MSPAKAKGKRIKICYTFDKIWHLIKSLDIWLRRRVKTLESLKICFVLFLFYYSPDINNKDIRDANKANDESDDEGESMDWWSKYFASLDKLIMVKFIVYCQ